MASSGSSKSSPSTGGNKASGQQSEGSASRREAHREQLRKQRQAELKRQRLVRNGIIIGAIVVVLAIIGGIILAVTLSRRDDEAKGALVAPAGIATDVPYYTLGAPADSGAPVVDLYVDFMCPVCGNFHQINGSDLDSMVEKKEVTLQLHTRTFLDSRSSTGDYSTRAANAIACVADEDPALILPLNDLLFENQPGEGTAGLTNAKLTELAKQAGASDDVSSCISSKKYDRWLNEVVEKEAAQKTDGTPAVFINGTAFEAWNQPGAFAQAVRAAGGGTSGGTASDAGGASDGGAAG